MQRLPKIIARGGALKLPLCGGTARRLAAALVAGRDARGDRSLLADALARDAALALWTVVRAHLSGTSDIKTLDALAGWLSMTAIDQWSCPIGADPLRASQARGEDAVDCGKEANRWIELAARSIGVATLAAQIARHQGLDEQAAHLLGLLQPAPQWLAAASGNSPTSPITELPPWLRGELDRIESAPHGNIASAVDCVRVAERSAAADDPAVPLPEGFTFDRQAQAAQVAAIQEDWLRESDGDLLSPLTEKLARLRDLEQNFRQALEAAKLESLKELAYGAGHEINNPLANISARAQTLLQLERDPERRRMLASINAQAFRAHEMIADMMLFARPPRAKVESFDVVELLTRLHDELGEQAARQQTQIVLDVPQGPCEVVADPTQIAVALRSLCSNALEALVTGGRIEIALVQPALLDGNVRITISDDGPGIPAEVRPHVFDPFYSGREAGRGLGLGLSKCWRIVTMHRGRVDVDSPDGGGAVFTVTLPAGNSR